MPFLFELYLQRKEDLVNSDIIRRSKKKEHKAFRELYEACIPYVYTLVREHIYQEDFRKDIIQEIFAQVFLNIGKFDPEKGEFRPWLRRLAINQCLMFLRDRKADFDYETLENYQELIDAPDLFHSKDGLDPNKIKALVKEMPEGYGKVFQLVVLEGYTHEEVGEIMEISPKSSRSQLTRARKWLRNYMKENKLTVRYGYF